jgi:hypothetical protein
MVDHMTVIDREFDPQTVEDEWLAAISSALRSTVRKLLKTPRYGGRGLRAWLALMETEGRPLRGQIPDELIEIYLQDDEAEPLHDCASCGLPVPVRVGRRVGLEPVVERVYFPTCPLCGGRTGRYAFWSRPASTR